MHRQELALMVLGLLVFSLFPLLTLQVKAQETTIFSDNFVGGSVKTAGDLNGDYTVNILDAAAVSAHWFPGPPIGPLGYDINYDINEDGRINILDGAIVSANWGRTVYGIFPPGWDLVWNGAGYEYQILVDSVSVSPKMSCQLLGSNGLSSVVKKDFTSTSNVIGYEAYVRTEAYTGGTQIVAHVGFFNTPIDTWGRYYALVRFEDNGYIRSGGEILQSYSSNTWYKVRVTLDKTTRVYNVWIDDVLKGQNLVETNDPKEILSFELAGEQAGVKTYFDDVAVFDETFVPPQVGVPEFDVSIVMMTSVLLCGWLLTQSRATKRRKDTKEIR